LPPTFGQKYHSVIQRPGRVLSQCVFFQGNGDPEVYPRGDGDVYVCGFPDPPEVVQEVLNPEPCALCAEPCALNPEPCALCAEPCALCAEPCALCAEPWAPEPLSPAP
jgi:hypothetical protein